MPFRISSKNLLIILFLIIILSAAIFILLKTAVFNEKGIKIITENKEYKKGDILKINIKNNLKKRVCFSSCYPYYLEKKGEGNQWKSYSYGECRSDDLAEKCLDAKKKKGFEIVLFSLMEKGPHRLSVPFCRNCEPGKKFIKENWSYSNQFIIN